MKQKISIRTDWIWGNIPTENRLRNPPFGLPLPAWSIWASFESVVLVSLVLVVPIFDLSDTARDVKWILEETDAGETIRKRWQHSPLICWNKWKTEDDAHYPGHRNVSLAKKPNERYTATGGFPCCQDQVDRNLFVDYDEVVELVSLKSTSPIKKENVWLSRWLAGCSWQL